VQLRRGDYSNELCKFPYAFTLLSVIALRARRTAKDDGPNIHNLNAREALIGDYVNYGMSEQNYRTAKKQLEDFGLITTQATNRGTIATICSTEVYDINLDENAGASNERTNGQANDPANSSLTTKEEVKKPNKEKEKKESVSILSKDFYIKEIKEAGEDVGKKYLPQYREFVNLLFGGEIPSSGILKIEKQLSYVDFEKVLLKASSQGKMLSDLISSMANDGKYTRGKKSLYLTLNNWLNQKKG